MASRKEQKAALRAERERRAAEAAASARRKRMIGYVIGGGLALAAVAAIVIAVAASGGGGGGSTANASKVFPKESIPPAKPGLTYAAAAKAAGCTVITHPAEGHTHVLGSVKYKTNPPSSGNHYPVPVHDGAYTKAPPVTHLVHALEHGRMIIWFKATAPPAVRGQLKALFDEDPSRIVLTPDTTGMPYMVAASAWTGDLQHGGTVPEFGHVLGCPTMNANVIQALRVFRSQFRGLGPEHQYDNIPE